MRPSLGHPCTLPPTEAPALPREALQDSRPGDAHHREVIPREVKHFKQMPVNALFTDQQERKKSLGNLFD